MLVEITNTCRKGRLVARESCKEATSHKRIHRTQKRWVVKARLTEKQALGSKGFWKGKHRTRDQYVSELVLQILCVIQGTWGGITDTRHFLKVQEIGEL